MWFERHIVFWVVALAVWRFGDIEAKWSADLAN